jgi:glutaredoxin
MKIQLYTKDGCTYCDKAKALLTIKGYNFSEVNVSKTDTLLEEFKAQYPTVRTMPFILIDGVPIGGYDKLNEWVNENGKQFLAE